MEHELKKAATTLPLVTILGPRQSGKTTLVKQTFPDKPYINLELIHVRELALIDPVAFLEKYPEGAILDEIQEVPTLLSYIQVGVDLLGRKRDSSLQAATNLNSMLQLLNLWLGELRFCIYSLEELTLAGIKKNVDELLYERCYPKIHADGLNPTKTYASYVRTYIE